MKLNAFKLITILFILLLVLISSCSKNEDNPVFYSPDRKMPVVTGLFIKGEHSPEVLRVWRTPTSKSLSPSIIDSKVKIRFSIPESGIVQIWVVPARLPDQDPEEVLTLFNGIYISPKGIAVKVLANEEMHAGTYELIWDIKDEEGNEFPGGFYRTYIKAGSFFDWADVFYYKGQSNIPPDLYELVKCIIEHDC